MSGRRKERREIFQGSDYKSGPRATSGKMIQNEAKIFSVLVYLFIECRVVSGVGRA